MKTVWVVVEIGYMDDDDNCEPDRIAGVCADEATALAFIDKMQRGMYALAHFRHEEFAIVTDVPEL